MGTLKLGCIKTPHHLGNSIEYIFRKDKTENGIYIFGDSGYTPEMVCETFNSTKDFFGKRDGRQAYHFVLTFAAEDDVGPDQAKEITLAAVKKLFPLEEYNWAGAVHTDSNHIHAHIIFNSVSNITGLKYRYNKGDWEKYIQKTVDDICNERGLKTIAYDYNAGEAVLKIKDKEGRQGTNHEKNPEIKKKADIIREDIDRYVLASNTYEDFLQLMKGDGYEIREGESKKYGEYITFTPYGIDKGVRTYRLGEEYSKSRIIERISEKHVEIGAGKDISDEAFERILRIHNVPTITFRRYYVKQLYIARRWKNARPFPGSYVYKKAIIEYEKLEEEWKLFRSANFRSYSDVEIYQHNLEENIQSLKKQRKSAEAGSYRREELDSQIKECSHSMRVLKRLINKIEAQTGEDQRSNREEPAKNDSKER